MSGATSSRSRATSSRKRCGSSASAAAIAVKDAAEHAAFERLLDALTGKGSSEATRASFRQRFADHSLDGAEVEIEVSEAPAMPFDMPGNGVGMINLSRDDVEGDGRRAQEAAQAQGPRRLRQAGRRGSRQARRFGRRHPRRAGRCRGQWHRLPRRDRQDRGQRRARRVGQPRRRPARPAAADRGDDGRDQIWADQDRPHPVHRLGRVPRRQAVGPAPRASGAACRSGSSLPR